MKKSLFFKLLCVFSFVFGLFSVSTGLSDYIIDKTTYDENGTLSNQATSANDNGEKVMVSFKLQFIESKTTPEYGEFNYSTTNSGKRKYNVIITYDHISKPKINIGKYGKGSYTYKTTTLGVHRIV